MELKNSYLPSPICASLQNVGESTNSFQERIQLPKIHHLQKATMRRQSKLEMAINTNKEYRRFIS